MVEGKKTVEYVPAELLEEVRVHVHEGNSYKSEVAELMAINAQLLFLARRVAKQQQAAAKRSKQR
jgi:succinyl-CoA synthetase beta subunit